MNKKIIAVLISLLFCFSLFGCGKTTEDVSNDSANDSTNEIDYTEDDNVEIDDSEENSEIIYDAEELYEDEE